VAAEDRRASVPDKLTGTGLTIGVVRARWNDDIVGRLAQGVSRSLSALKVTRTVEVTVPGCFEIPLAAGYLAGSGQVDAVVCIGAVIRGETTHYELVSGECARGVQEVQLRTGVPVLFGVLTVESVDQAMARSEEAGGHNVGEEAAAGAVEMARLAQKWAPFAERG
jgi:6,7-dimethyl-8-ribityllumazine synthase